MIEVATGTALIEGLAGLTTEMTGQSLSDAYNQRMSDSYEDASGVSIGVGNYSSTQPAISGNTNGTVVSSINSEPLDSDPLAAIVDYVATGGGQIDPTSGGALLGSAAITYNYSLMQTAAGVVAVAPVAVPVGRAVTAVSQLLGVSMEYTALEQEAKIAMDQTMARYAYAYGDMLITAWWDGVNMLFPRRAVADMEALFRQEGIGNPNDEEESTIDGSYSWLEYMSLPLTSVPSYYYETANRYYVMTGVNCRFIGGTTSGGGRFVYAIASGSSPAQWTMTTTNKTTGTTTTETKYGSSSDRTHVSNTTFYYGAASAPPSGSATSLPFNVADPVPRAIGTVLIDGVTTQGGSYPSGASGSQAPHYTSTSVPSAGGIASSANTTEDVVAISLDDGLNSIGSTEDPNRGTVQEEVTDLPAPPLAVPVPDTNVSNPDVPVAANPSIADSAAIDAATDALADSITANPPQSGGIIDFPQMPGYESGGAVVFPSIVPSSGPGLIHVYNPTPAEMVSFGNWLWVTYADTTIDKIWNNPFDGIIGAFELYCTPATDGTDNIRSGFLTCPTLANLVRQRYIEIDCGTVVVPEFYGNYLDYSPYSQCYIYLPFIGINEVSIDDIVGHAVNIRYRVDCYNGSCISMIYVAKSGYRNLCYQFAGNCAVEVPLAGGSQAAIKAGVIQAEAYARANMINAGVSGLNSIGQGMVGGAIGGGLLGAVAGGLTGFANAVAGNIAASQNNRASMEAARVANKSSVQHSGQFGASHGAMGFKKPFIMIRNPIQVKVVNYNDDYGFPAHKRVVIGGCTGYLRVREVNVISAHATDAEKHAIESALKGGVYVS